MSLHLSSLITTSKCHSSLLQFKIAAFNIELQLFSYLVVKAVWEKSGTRSFFYLFFVKAFWETSGTRSFSTFFCGKLSGNHQARQRARKKEAL
jgi:hypothetical protein